MFGRLSRLLVAAIVAGAALTVVLSGPSAALACNGGTSAVNVYKECTQSGGGGTSGGKSSTGGSQTGSTTTQHLSSQTEKALSNAGKDKATLRKLVAAYGLNRQLQTVHGSSDTSPSAVGSAFDLGTGPTMLLIILAGTAALLLGGSGMRVWRNRRRA